MGVPILIFVVGFGVGSALPARWLPDLGEGRIAGVAFLVICGLVGMVFALAMLRDIGPILGLAAAVYLFAPAPEQDESPGGRLEVAPGYSSEQRQ